HVREQLVAAENERKVAVTGGSPEEIAQLDSDLVKTNAEIDRLRSERDSLERLYPRAATRQEIEQTKTALAKAEADKRLIEEKRRARLKPSKLRGRLCRTGPGTVWSTSFQKRLWRAAHETSARCSVLWTTKRQNCCRIQTWMCGSGRPSVKIRLPYRGSPSGATATRAMCSSSSRTGFESGM